MQKSSRRSVFELGNMPTNSSFIFRHTVFRDSGMMLLKSTVLLLVKDRICVAHFHVIFVVFERVDIDYKFKLILYNLKSCMKFYQN
jgi:hypothetical protein